MVVLVRCRCGETRDDIPLLPFSVSRILPAVQILISSLSVQNPPVLLPQKSVCLPLSALIADGEASPFPASAGSKGITLDFPTENRVPTGMLLAPIGNPEPRGCSLCNSSFSSQVHIQSEKSVYLHSLTIKSRCIFHPVIG